MNYLPPKIRSGPNARNLRIGPYVLWLSHRPRYMAKHYSECFYEVVFGWDHHLNWWMLYPLHSIIRVGLIQSAKTWSGWSWGRKTEISLSKRKFWQRQLSNLNCSFGFSLGLQPAGLPGGFYICQLWSHEPIP